MLHPLPLPELRFFAEYADAPKQGVPVSVSPADEKSIVPSTVNDSFTVLSSHGILFRDFAEIAVHRVFARIK